jgi:hypothetical protein
MVKRQLLSAHYRRSTIAKQKICGRETERLLLENGYSPFRPLADKKTYEYAMSAVRGGPDCQCELKFIYCFAAKRLPRISAPAMVQTFGFYLG